MGGQKQLHQRPARLDGSPSMPPPWAATPPAAMLNVMPAFVMLQMPRMPLFMSATPSQHRDHARREGQTTRFTVPSAHTRHAHHSQRSDAQASKPPEAKAHAQAKARTQAKDHTQTKAHSHTKAHTQATGKDRSSARHSATKDQRDFAFNKWLVSHQHASTAQICQAKAEFVSGARDKEIPYEDLRAARLPLTPQNLKHSDQGWREQYEFGERTDRHKQRWRNEERAAGLTKRD